MDRVERKRWSEQVLRYKRIFFPPRNVPLLRPSEECAGACMGKADLVRYTESNHDSMIPVQETP